MKLSSKSCFLLFGVIVAASLTSCTPGERGALIGGALGAGTGALIGNETGALVGGAVGAIAGSEISKNRAARNHYYHQGNYGPPPGYRNPPYQEGYHRNQYPYRGRGY